MQKKQRRGVDQNNLFGLIWGIRRSVGSARGCFAIAADPEPSILP